VDEQQRQGTRGIRVSSRPEERRQRPAEAQRLERQLTQRPGCGLVVADPFGRLVARELDHTLVAEGAECPHRVRQIRRHAHASGAIRQLEQVFEPVGAGRTRERQSPPAVVDLELDSPRPPQLVEQRDAAERRIGDLELDGVLRHDRPRKALDAHRARIEACGCAKRRLHFD
jgi:hypothetical protein